MIGERHRRAVGSGQGEDEATDIRGIHGHEHGHAIDQVVGDADGVLMPFASSSGIAY
jgi:hypothetical protein